MSVPDRERVQRTDCVSESESHRALKLVGMAFLHNRGCKPIATEVSIRDFMPVGIEWKDKRSFIDVLGVGKNPILETQYWSTGGTWQKTIGYKTVLRGIEVKVSQRDFDSGFVRTGCNYLYILSPLGVIDKSEIPVNIGFLEYDVDKHDISLGEDFSFYSSALRITKKPRQVKTEIKMDEIVTQVWQRSRSVLIGLLADALHTTQDFKFSKRHVIIAHSYDGSSGVVWVARLRRPRSPYTGRGETKVDAIINLFTKMKDGVC